mmetsp:Transcript_75399/g.208107  ORF Transcript_75399/g.208107 Transcript_75399/m.208107 type:complete len:92 (+) Transcript_75399:2030-2305(+)
MVVALAGALLGTGKLEAGAEVKVVVKAVEEMVAALEMAEGKVEAEKVAEDWGATAVAVTEAEATVGAEAVAKVVLMVSKVEVRPAVAWKEA